MELARTKAAAWRFEQGLVVWTGWFDQTKSGKKHREISKKVSWAIKIEKVSSTSKSNNFFPMDFCAVCCAAFNFIRVSFNWTQPPSLRSVAATVAFQDLVESEHQAQELREQSRQDLQDMLWQLKDSEQRLWALHAKQAQPRCLKQISINYRGNDHHRHHHHHHRRRRRRLLHLHLHLHRHLHLHLHLHCHVISST